MKLNDKVESIMVERFGVDNVMALATICDGMPCVRYVNAYYENGAFYITSREDLIKTKNRISGRIRAVEMDEDSFFEIDEPSDWIIIEALMKKGNK